MSVYIMEKAVPLTVLVRERKKMALSRDGNGNFLENIHCGGEGKLS